MASMPSFEQILLQVHRCLDIPFDSKKKTALLKLDQKLANKQRYFFELVGNVFEQLNLVDHLTSDLFTNIDQWGSFNERIRNLVCTHQAEPRQIIWYLAGYLYMPSLGKQLAYWQIEEPLDRGMPSGKFWYLPEDCGDELKLPVVQVLEWLEDLIGEPLIKNSSAIGGGSDRDDKGATSGVSSDSHLRTIYGWRSQKAYEPKVGTIHKYFSDGTELQFKGVLSLDSGLDLDARFEEVKAFVGKRGLTVESLQYEVADPEVVVCALSSTSDNVHEIVKTRFVELITERYSKPSMRTIRQRLLVARAAQAGYKALFDLLVGDSVDYTCADPRKNKVLQLIQILKMSYNLTMDAHIECPRNWNEQDRYFDVAIPELYRGDLFLSVMMTASADCTESLVHRLSRIFNDLEAGEDLETLLHFDEASAQEVLRVKKTRWTQWAAEDAERKSANDRIRSKSPWRVLQVMEHYRAVSSLLQDTTLSFKARWQAMQRMRELARTPEQKVGAVISELSLILHNDDRKQQTAASRDQVEELLVEAKELGAEELCKAVWLNYKAKHRLSCNEFDEARVAFKEALIACGERCYGSLHGQIARDGLALELGMPISTFNLNSYEYYYSNMLLNDAFEEDFDPNTTFEDVAVSLAEYFWGDLYKPYPGEQREDHLSLASVDEMCAGLKLVQEGRQDEMQQWLKCNKSDLGSKRLREVRGDTGLMFLLKMLSDCEAKKRHPLMASNGAAAELSTMCESIRETILLIIDAWPKLTDLHDYKCQSPLMLAVNNDEPVIRDRLLLKGADVTKQDFKRRTALHAAVAANSLISLEVLLSARGGARALKMTDVAEHSILHTAVKMGNPDIVALILSKLPELADTPNCEGQSPRGQAQELAKEEGFYSLIVKAMRQEGRDHGSLAGYREVDRLLRAVEVDVIQ